MAGVAKIIMQRESWLKSQMIEATLFGSRVIAAPVPSVSMPKKNPTDLNKSPIGITSPKCYHNFFERDPH